MNVSHFNTQKLNDAANLCQNIETKGFDIEAGQSWIYPTNYSLRDYQFNIIQQALHKNTLVSLPTGLGKTFIAAVVMFNFYRWYPNDKIIFMAPTRPLVKQQMEACYNITAIPQDVTAELTGTKDQQSRTEIWQTKRVFFITPQVLQNDLNIIIELASKIKCLVFDEAHRAKGNHAYCEVIRKLLAKNKLFRVLALSATPGNSSKDVIEVMQNLLIAHVEFRSEDSPDVKPYVFERALETVVVPLGEKLQQIKDDYIQILEKYTRTLIKYKVIYGNCTNLTKGKIFMVMKEFQAKNAGNRNPNYGEIMKSLNICVTLYHAYETLIRCGLRAFQNFYEEHINNPLLSGNMSLRNILENLRDYLGPNPEVKSLPDGTFTEIAPNIKFGHPKLYKLQDILLTHFQNADTSTRIIVFFEYRESVAEAYALLSKSYPQVRARVFVGQGSGVTQRDQINTIKAFREGTCNTLLSTCIGEEGLDVGDVDLIICFDIANKSPIRMIQRMGRTGRKKEGRVVVLVTEGKEQQTLKDCLIYKNNLGSFISNPQQLEAGKYQENPKLIPSYIEPKCQKMFITVKKPTTSRNLKDMLKKMSDGPNLGDYEIIEIEEKINDKIYNFFDKKEPLEFQLEKPKINFGKYLEKQRGFQAHGTVKHSQQSEILVSLLQFADSKRYNLPVTQQISKFSDFNQNKILKQGDIRNMFAKAPSITLSQESYVSNSQVCLDKEITHCFPSELFDEISAFLSIEVSKTFTCKTCDFLFKCPKVNFRETPKLNVTTWVVPDLSILESLSDLQVFADSLSPKSREIHWDFMDLDDEFNNITFSEIPDNIKNKTLAYETPRNFDKILKNFQISETIENKIVDKSFGYETPKNFGKVLNLLGNSLVAEFPVLTTTKNDKIDLSELLAFFKLSSLKDFFDCPDDLEKTIIYTPEQKNTSPDLFNDSPDLFSSFAEQPESSIKPESPILCSYERVQNAKKKLFNSFKVEDKPNLSNLKLNQKSFFEFPKNNSRDSSTTVSPTVSFNDKKIESPKKDELDISDLCDLTAFGFTESNKPQSGKKVKENNQIRERLVSLDDFCDLSTFLSPLNKIENQNNFKFDQVCQPSSFFQEKNQQIGDGDATDSDLDFSPVKPKVTQSLNKSPSQLTVSQTLSFIRKAPQRFDSQKENEANTKFKNSQKSNLNFSSKKNILKTTQDSPRSSQPNFNFKATTPKPKKILNISLAGDSDDEFETTSSPIFMKPKIANSVRGNSQRKVSTSKTKTSLKFSEFIEHEAEVSEDERVVVSEDEDSGDDQYEASFIADETHDFNNTTIHAKYLESVKSPARKGTYKIPNKFKHNITNVYSQPVSHEDNTYLNDSFCVEDSGEDSKSEELTELEILEEKLKEMKKNKKRKKSIENQNTKRRRIIDLDKDSD